MTTSELRAKYLAFFQAHGHEVHASGSLVPYDVTGHLDESLLFNGAGMVQFKPYFRGAATPSHQRMTTAQKCVRTGDIDEVGDVSHLTFFEMLGNFSFGDYFKVEAIAMSWEFLTSPRWLGLDPHRLAFTVFTEDDEAYAEWERHLAGAGIEPATRIFRLGEETNYWPAGAFSSGPPGPCGPNSEMFYWTGAGAPPTGAYTAEDYARDERAGKWLEIWNDVFIQYEWQGHLKNPDRPADGYIKDGMPDLPFQSIDTGMGLERTAAVLGGFDSVYDTDAFQPILKQISAISNVKYGDSEVSDRAMRIIADHVRTACFCIADGILPGNAGRGYVLRRLIRRAVLKGQRVLGLDQAFFFRIAEAVISAMGDHYGELRERSDVIRETLVGEEALFRRTVAQGAELLANLLADGRKVLAGELAFRLHDTFGFPLEVTQELCGEAGVTVDLEGYEVAMHEAQERSRGASGMDCVYGGGAAVVLVRIREQATATRFVGHETTHANAVVVAAIPEISPDGRATGRIAVALDQTPFYAESGGQVSDEGRLVGAGFELKVLDLVRQDGVFVHLCEPVTTTHPDPFAGMDPDALQQVLNAQVFRQEVSAEVDKARRARIIRNHTATHLLHAALRERLGKHVTQAGSQVAPGALRFDFTHGKALSAEELADVEEWVNAHALAGHPVVSHPSVPIAQAKAMGAMALFGEKYGDTVRVVEIRSDDGRPVSIELCGGVHTMNTGQVGLFKIVHEGSAASGVRRIEALTGEGAISWANEQFGTVHRVAEMLKSSPHDVIRAVEKTLETLKEERRKRERLAAQGGEAASVESTLFGSVELALRRADGLDSKEVQSAVDQLVSPSRVAVVVAVSEGRVAFAVKVGAEALAKGAHAGNLVRQLATATGGGGGGRPDFATAGGRDPGRLGQALRDLPAWVEAQIGG